MSELKSKGLARNYLQIKKLDSSVNINTYYQEIKYFLFGTSDSTPIDIKNLPKGGINEFFTNGSFIPTETSSVRLTVSGKSAALYKIPNLKNAEFVRTLNPTADPSTKRNPAEYFFPSDFVAILVELAQIFYKSGYNVTGLKDYAFTNPQEFIKNWGNPNSDEFLRAASDEKGIPFFYELSFDGHKSDLQNLLNQVNEAAQQFENKKEKPDLSEFLVQTEVESLILKDFSKQAFTLFIEKTPEYLKKTAEYEEKIKPILEADENKIKNSVEEIQEKSEEKIEKLVSQTKSDFFRDLFGKQETLDKFRDLGNFDPDSKYFLFETRTQPLQVGIKETEIYKNFIKVSLEAFLEKNHEELLKEFILPLFKTEETETEPSPETKDEGGEAIVEEIKFDSPIDEETFKKKILEDVTKALIKKFDEEFCPQYRQNFLEKKDKLASNYLEEVSRELHKQVQEKVVGNLEIGEEDLQKLTENPEKILYSEGNFNPEILESEWYQELIQQSINYIEGLPSPDSSYSSYFSYLFETHIQPFLTEIEQKEKPEEPPQPTQAEPEDFTSGVVSPVIPVSTGTSPTKTIETQSEQINTLTQEQIRTLQYESAWMYNRAVYELYTSKGVKIEDIPQDELNNLQSSIFSYLSGMQSTEGSDFNKLFGSASARQKALMEFYTKNSTFITQINGGLISKFIDAEALLSIGIKDSIKLDSKVLTDNIKNTVDSLIVQYGLNQDFYAIDTTSDPNNIKVQKFSGDNPHDIIWFLDSIPPERLALIFNIPPGVLKNEDIIKQLREVLKSYARYRGSELSLHIQNTTLQKGLTVISAEDAEKIKNGDEKTITKHLSFTNDIRSMTKANGGEVVAGALDHKSGETDPKRSGHKKEIQKQFKTFLPLWGQLTGLEQAEVYKNFGLAIPAEYLTNGKPDKKKLEVAKLEFIQEFIFFDVSKLGNIKQIIKRKNADEALQLKLQEIAEIQNQLVRERELAKLLNAEFYIYSDPSELQEIGEYVGVDTNEMSFREKFYADDEIQSGGSDEYEVQEVGPGRRGLVPRFLDTNSGKRLKERFGRRFKKKFSAQKKAEKAFTKAAGAALTKVAAASLNAIPGVGTALSAALLAIKNKKVREFVSGLVALTLGAIIGRTIWALGSIGGAIGGLIGGAVGFVVSGGAMVVPGVVIGANIGEAIIPTRIVGSSSPIFGNTNNNQGYSAEATRITQTAATQNILVSYGGVAIIAAGGFALTSVFITIFTIFTIYSAFLIPIPIDRPTVGIGDGGPPIGGIGADSCDDPTPLSDKITKNTTSSIAGRAYDIVNKLLPGFWCYWNWNPDYDGLNATFTGPASESPDLFNEVEFDRYPYHCVYSNSFPAGCEGDYRAMDGNALYWCTWLVNHSYQNNYSLAARIMADQFRTLPGHIFMPVESIKYTDLQPGDVIFTSTEGRNGNIGHVAILHDVGPDYIRSIDSNASARYHSFTVNTDGSIQADSIPYLGVVGFGRRL